MNLLVFTLLTVDVQLGGWVRWCVPCDGVPNACGGVADVAAVAHGTVAAATHLEAVVIIDLLFVQQCKLYNTASHN